MKQPYPESCLCGKGVLCVIILVMGAGCEISKADFLWQAEDFVLAFLGDETVLQIMHLELWVPYKHLNNESYLFMLLPGYEKRIIIGRD